MCGVCGLYCRWLINAVCDVCWLDCGVYGLWFIHVVCGAHGLWFYTCSVWYVWTVVYTCSVWCAWIVVLYM